MKNRKALFHTVPCDLCLSAFEFAENFIKQSRLFAGHPSGNNGVLLIAITRYDS
jgi:hypothetical protein